MSAPRDEFEAALDADQAAWRSFGYHRDDAALQDQIYREGMEARATLRALYAAALERAEGYRNGQLQMQATCETLMASCDKYAAEVAALKAERDALRRMVDAMGRAALESEEL